MSYDFSNARYVENHGKNPRGLGLWAFTVRRYKNPNIARDTFIDDYANETTFFMDEVLTLTEAKKRACEILKSANVPTYKTIYVSP